MARLAWLSPAGYRLHISTPAQVYLDRGPRMRGRVTFVEAYSRAHRRGDRFGLRMLILVRRQLRSADGCRARRLGHGQPRRRGGALDRAHDGCAQERSRPAGPAAGRRNGRARVRADAKTRQVPRAVRPGPEIDPQPASIRSGRSPPTTPRSWSGWASCSPKVEALMAKLRRNVELVRQGQRERGHCHHQVGRRQGPDGRDQGGSRHDLCRRRRELLAGRQVTARALRGWVLGLIGLCLARRDGPGGADAALDAALRRAAGGRGEAAPRDRGDAAPGAEARGRGPAHRRHRARLQQPADDHPRQPRHHPAPHCAGGRRACREAEGAARPRPAGRPQRRAAHAPAARILAPPGARAQAPRSQRRRHRACRSCCAGRSARPSMSRPCWPAACGRRSRTPTSSRTP